MQRINFQDANLGVAMGKPRQIDDPTGHWFGMRMHLALSILAGNHLRMREERSGGGEVDKLGMTKLLEHTRPEWTRPGSKWIDPDDLKPRYHLM